MSALLLGGQRLVPLLFFYAISSSAFGVSREALFFDAILGFVLSFVKAGLARTAFQGILVI